MLTRAVLCIGRLNQNEFCLRTDHFLSGDTAVEHLHNQLLIGIFANVGRDQPEPGVAPWVSANDKPVITSKPTAGDAAEQRLKTEVMQLPPRDRRRVKDIPEVSECLETTRVYVLMRFSRNWWMASLRL